VEQGSVKAAGRSQIDVLDDSLLPQCGETQAGRPNSNSERSAAG
jgi:hypothetical protein